MAFFLSCFFSLSKANRGVPFRPALSLFGPGFFGAGFLGGKLISFSLMSLVFLFTKGEGVSRYGTGLVMEY